MENTTDPTPGQTAPTLERLCRVSLLACAAWASLPAQASCVEQHPLTSQCVRWADGTRPAGPQLLAAVRDQPAPGAAHKALAQPKIVGGTIAPASANPWQVALVARQRPSAQEGQFCGGANIGGGWVLTAAHCVDEAPASAFEIFSGSDSLRQGGRRTGVARVVIHPEWNRERLQNDIALVQVQGGASGLAGEPVLGPAGLPEAILRFLPVRSTGWGRNLRTDAMAQPELLTVDLPYVTLDRCGAPQAYGTLVNEKMLCAGPDDTSASTCNGDSGGPATAEFGGVRRLVGLVSFGKPGCNKPFGYSVFTKVSAFLPWITSVTEGSSAAAPGTRGWR
ncbi:MAG: serine protease [Rubrivivax sp.]|nr:serine protease [Rubrivivax sp.]